MVNRLLDLEKLLGAKHSSFLFGPRGVGKTSLAKRFVENQSHAKSIDLLNLDIYRRYLTEPEFFRRELEKAIPEKGILSVLIDEVQKLPSLLDEVHHLIEEHKGKIRFLLTGSSARKLKRGGANLLAGRAWTLKLHPLTSREVDLDLHRALRFGMLPAIYLEDDFPQRSLKAYVETYLKEEIFQESLVRQSENFIRFLDVAGQCNGDPANFAQIAKDCGVSPKTAQDYFSILVDTMLAFRIDGWSHSVRKQLRQAPKFYLFDCGVLNAIRGELDTELKTSSYRYGKLFETFLIGEMIRLNDYSEANFRFSYWRTNSGMEVDCVLSKGPSSPPIAIEIKSQSNPGVGNFNGLLAFASENPNAKLYGFCTTHNSYDLGPIKNLGTIKVLPWQDGLQMLFPHLKSTS